MAKALTQRGGIAPPQGLIRPARSSSATRRPAFAASCAAVAPDGPPPTTTRSKVTSPHILSAPACLMSCRQNERVGRFPETVPIAHRRREQRRRHEEQRFDREHRGV